MQKTLFGAQPWQSPSRGFKSLGSGNVCNAASLDPIPTQIMAATEPTPPASGTLDTLTPTLVLGSLGAIALVAFGIIRI